MDGRIISTTAARQLLTKDHGWIAPYLRDCHELRRRGGVPREAAWLLVARRDYPGNLLLSLLRSQQQLNTVRSDDRVTLAYASRQGVEQNARLVYDSLSLEFVAPDTDLVRAAVQPLLIFADTDVSVIDATPDVRAIG